jgi:hypothetical protein
LNLLHSFETGVWLLIAQSFLLSTITLVVSNYVVARKALRGFQQFTQL